MEKDIVAAMLRQKVDEHISKTIVLKKISIIDRDYIPKIKHQLGMLLDWAAEYCYEMGSTPETVRITKRSIDRDTEFSIELWKKNHPEEWRRILYFMYKKDLQQTRKIHDYCLLKQVLEAEVETERLKRRYVSIICLFAVSLVLGHSIVKNLGWL